MYVIQRANYFGTDYYKRSPKWCNCFGLLEDAKQFGSQGAATREKNKRGLRDCEVVDAVRMKHEKGER